jgi:hypothetical protein
MTDINPFNFGAQVVGGAFKSLFVPSTATTEAARANLQAELEARARARAQGELAMRAGMGEIEGGAVRAAGELRQGTASGLSSMGGLYDQASQALSQGGLASLAYLQGGYGQGVQAMGQGYGGARATLQGMGGPTDAIRAAQLGQISSQGLGAGYQASPGYEFARQQAQQAVMRQAAAMGGRGGGAALKAMSQAGQGVAAQDFADYASRAMAAKQIQVGALGSQASRMDAMRQAQALGVAGIQANAGTGLAGLYGMQGQGLSAQQQAIASAMAGASQRYGSQALGAQQAMGTQLGSLYGTRGANIAAALTGQAQLGADLSTGIDRSSILATAGGQGQAIQGGVRDLAQLAMLQYLQGRR